MRTPDRQSSFLKKSVTLLFSLRLLPTKQIVNKLKNICIYEKYRRYLYEAIRNTEMNMENKPTPEFDTILR
jgi:hypothetical protein